MPNRDSPPAVLLREAYRDENGQTQKRTLANLSKLPGDVVEALKAILKGGTLIGRGPEDLQIERSLPHGHVAAVLGMIRKIALDRLILSTAKDAEARRYCDLVVAMMVDRLIAPRSKLGFVRAVDEETATTSLGDVLGLGHVRDREAYEALDWLLDRQASIENGLAERHLKDGMLVLYDVTSSYFEGHHCPLAQYGHSRDHRATGCRSSMGCSVRARACRSRSRCSRAIRQIRPPSRRRSISSRAASVSSASCWSAIAA